MALKYIEEYRDGVLARGLVKKIHSVSKKDLRLMEVCGTHTTAIFRHGIRSVLPQGITLLSGPGCPVCVTAQKDIDAFVEFARVKNVIVTTFGDLIKVPGSSSTLGKEKASGADVRIVYSVFDAINIARENKDKEVVFCGVGFETTIPTIAAGILMGIEGKVDNFSVYSANKLTPPALAALMETDGVEIDGFILPGHVSVITGTDAYRDTFEKYDIPSVISGFEPIDILQAILLLIQQNEAEKPALENAYPRAVSDAGNGKAKQIMNQVFEVCNASWRGIGEIPLSGMELKKEYQKFDAAIRFGMDMPDVPEPKGCACGEILMGLKSPYKCPLYKKKCTPMNPVGPCMVSSEGSCAAFYRYS
ncbi:hydrogenase formation protein HypD [Desulfobacula sp.]|uniref:hydrogenase formation protein HypD n=1 Tax=Desulfobacula sp. TaxID=2593537 RepID=UPI002632FE87|nr:hydrogenase formation protein HypD [Desulfobacula sp.]